MNVTWNKGNERKVYDRIRTRLVGESCHMIRVENVAEQGTPDLNIRWGDHEIWIELKYSSDLLDVHIRPAQHAWHYKRYLACADGVCILAGNEELFTIFRPPYSTQPHRGGLWVQAPEARCHHWKNLDGFCLLETLFGLR